MGKNRPAFRARSLHRYARQLPERMQLLLMTDAAMLRPRGVANGHDAEGIDFRLGGIVCGALAHLVALAELLDLFELRESLAQSGLGIVELSFEIVDRVFEIFAPLRRRLGVGRIGEMAGIVDSDPLLL